MDLSKIGFYTLNNHRAINSSISSPLYRCEMIVTDRCNFNCPYCRPLNERIKGDIDFDLANYILDVWFDNSLKNVRFSGGEPTLYPFLDLLIKKCKRNNVERIAVSTNGSSNNDYYKYLFDCGVNDFSISLDACCSSTGKTMCGVDDQWENVIKNINEISKLTYVTVGVVLNESNFSEVPKIVEMASELGVSDIRIIPSSHNGQKLKQFDVPETIIKKHPILRYRMNNCKMDKNIRGIRSEDSSKCYLCLDDMAVCKDYHFPCIIYMREGGDPIGKVNNNVRNDRYEWFINHNSYSDTICKNNCLDVCVEYNNIAMKGNK